MRKIIFLLFLASNIQAQTVTYHIELTARPDSFFLVETIQQSVQGSPRPQEKITALLMRDTADLTVIRARLLTESNESQQRANEQSARAQLLAAQAAAIDAARQQTFDAQTPRVFAGQPPAPQPPATNPPPAKKKKSKRD